MDYETRTCANCVEILPCKFRLDPLSPNSPRKFWLCDMCGSNKALRLSDRALEHHQKRYTTLTRRRG
jgi:hypothetical protein